MKQDGKEPLYRTLRRARREAGITQAALAAQAGCTQSAVSMMELGRGEALSREGMEKIAAILKVELPAESSPAAVAPVAAAMRGLHVCGNFNCPSNVPYMVGSDVFFMPQNNIGKGRHCVFCGEVAVSACPDCGAEIVVAGGHCGTCGAALVAMPEGYADDLAAWLDARMETIARLRDMARNTSLPH